MSNHFFAALGKLSANGFRVSELMTDICKPKRTKLSSRGRYVCLYCCGPCVRDPLADHISSHMRISSSSVEKIKRAIGSWNFSAHDFSDEELVHCAKLMLEHALEMPEVEAYRISSGMIASIICSHVI